MNIQKIPIDKLIPNDWNPNHIKKAVMDKLRRYIKAQGSVLPIVARVHPKKKGYYQIIDGEHRHLIYKEFGYADADCVVIEATDDQAKILTVNLNWMRGQAKPREYAKLIHDLSQLHSIDDLALILPDDKPALLDKLELLKLPDEFGADLKAKAQQDEKDKLQTISFQVTDEQKAVIEASLSTVDSRHKGKALTDLVKAGSEAIKGSLKS